MGAFREQFGDLDTEMYVPYAANNWFKYADSAFVVRVLGQEDVWADGTDRIIYITATADAGGSGQEYIIAALAFSGNPGTVAVESGVDATTTAFGFSASSAAFSGTVSVASKTARNYIGNVFTATTGSLESQLMKVLDISGSEELGSSAYTKSAYTQTITSGTHPFSLNGYAQARSPVILSDIATAGEEGDPLFTIYTRSDGNAANRDIKIAIEEIDPTNATFDIVVREWDDKDSRQVVLERFNKLTMTKSATTYVARQIGDSRDGTGEFDPVSKHIYVEVTAGDHSGRVPAGFRGVNAPGEDANAFRMPNWPMKKSYDSSVATARQYFGVDWDNLAKDHVMYNDWSQWDLTETTNAIVLSGFHIDSGASSSAGLITSTSGLTGLSKAERKFLVPVLGGRDGWNRAAGPRKLLANASTTDQEDSWKDAIDTLENPEEYNINVLAIPGVSIADAIGSYAITMVEDRADTLYVGDMPDGHSTATAAVNAISSIDTNYAATYWPYVKFYDSDNSAFIWRPPTAQVLEALAYTDQVAYPWWAAAGLNRGLLTDVTKAEYRLTQADRDELYEGKINPIATFPGQGIAIWGQKTLQTRSTALDRINVRRMLLYARKVIAGAAKFVVFEPNDEATRDRLQAIIQPVLDLIRIKRGLEDFRIILDDTVNTPDVIDRGQIVAQIFIKPTKAAETIVLYFNLTPQGVSFEE